MEIIQQIGSYAGLAAVVGLAVLAALYFSQARDVKRLREWAGRAPERVPTPYRPPQRVVTQPVPPPPAAPPPAAPGARPAAPQPASAGAGPVVAHGPLAATPAAARAAEGASGVDAVTQNTVAHPPPRPPPQTLAPRAVPPGLGGHFAREAQIARAREEAARLGDQSEEGDGVEDTDGPDEGERDGDEGQDLAGARAEDGEGPEAANEAEIAGDDGGEEPEPDGEYEQEQGSEPAVLPEPEDFHEGDDIVEESEPSEPEPSETGRRPIAAPPPRPPPSPITATRRPLPPRAAPPPRAPQGPILPPYAQSRPGGRPSDTRKRSRSKAALAVGGSALLVAGAAFGVLQLTRGGDAPKRATKQPAQGAADTPPEKARPAAAAVNPRNVTVSVLNGTTVGGLAAELGDKLEAQGFKLGNVTNNTDQQRAESVVLFAPGHEREAKDVGRRLKVNQREPIDPDSQTRAGDASVVVVTGADLER